MATTIALWLKVKNRAIKLLTQSTLLKIGERLVRFGQTWFSAFSNKQKTRALLCSWWRLWMEFRLMSRLPRFRIGLQVVFIGSFWISIEYHASVFISFLQRLSWVLIKPSSAGILEAVTPWNLSTKVSWLWAQPITSHLASGIQLSSLGMGTLFQKVPRFT